jgi:starch synthase
MKIAIDNSDAIIQGSESLDPELKKYFESADKPKLSYFSIEEFAEPYSEFYQNEVLG